MLAFRGSLWWASEHMSMAFRADFNYKGQKETMSVCRRFGFDGKSLQQTLNWILPEITAFHTLSYLDKAEADLLFGQIGVVGDIWLSLHHWFILFNGILVPGNTKVKGSASSTILCRTSSRNFGRIPTGAIWPALNESWSDFTDSSVCLEWSECSFELWCRPNKWTLVSLKTGVSGHSQVNTGAVHLLWVMQKDYPANQTGEMNQREQSNMLNSWIARCCSYWVASCEENN